VAHSPSIRVVLIRTLVTGIAGGSILALMPLVARDLLSGGAQTYGIMLGAFGMGGVLGAINVASIRRYLDAEGAVRYCAATMGAAILVVATSHMPAITSAALVVAGVGWLISITLFNISVQLATPRWVAGRALAAYQAAIAGGVAIGSWLWGDVADIVGVRNALLTAGVVMIASPMLSIWLKLPTTEGINHDASDPLADPEVNLSITPRSGPIVVEIEYRVLQDRAREFYGVMQKVQSSRQRNGAYGWSISRDLADPELWTERFHCPTWLDYLRQRNRATLSERALHASASAFHTGEEPVKIRRMLERPVGSVRWKDETPDRAQTDVVPIPASTGSGV
jgi:hypothetical protein